MREELEINSSPDLLNDFLGQNGGDPVEPTVIEDGGTATIETVEPKPNLNELEISNELPEGFDVNTQEPNENPDPIQEPASEVEYSFKALAGYLSEEGIIDFEDSDELEDKPEVLIESVKNTIEKEIQAYKDSIPDKAKQIIEYLEKGGNIDTYLSRVQKPFDITSVDLTQERDQELIVRENLKLQGYEADEINETVQDYKDSLILDKQAKLADKQVKKYYEKVEADELAQQELEQAARVEQYKTYISSINNTIDTADSIAGLELDTKSKLAFKQYLLARDKEGLTAYERAVQEDPVKVQLELAYLKFMNYDFSKAAKKGETAATKKLKDIFKSSETNNNKGKSIEEVVTEKDQFSGFRGFLGKSK